MAKKQTRRTISLERLLYLATQERAASLTQSVSEYVSKLIRADLKSAGLAIPISGARFASEIKPRTFPLVEVGPAVSNVIAKKPEIDPKYATALEFTRRKLAEPKKPEPEPDKNECWWCGDRFKSGELPAKHEDHPVHGRCKREIGRLPPDVKAWPAK